MLGALGTILGARGTILEPWAPFSTICRQSVIVIRFPGEKRTPKRIPKIVKIMKNVVQMALEKHAQNISENSSIWECLQPSEPGQNPHESTIFSCSA